MEHKKDASNAFSLTELMVVIAIIGVLAAVAIPLYKQYINSTKLNAISTMVDYVATQETAYMELHGHVANAPELGSAWYPGNLYNLLSYQFFYPYAQYMYAEQDPNCALHGTFYWYFFEDNSGVASGYASNQAFIMVDVFLINGSWQRLWSYEASLPSSSNYISLPPNIYDLTNSQSSSDWGSKYASLLNQATCS